MLNLVWRFSFIKLNIFVTMKKILKPEPNEYYTNEKGYQVFKEEYHLRRGYCCKSGCKHCPYGYDKNTDRLKK